MSWLHFVAFVAFILTASAAPLAAGSPAPAASPSAAAPAAQAWQPPELVRIEGNEKARVLMLMSSPLSYTSFRDTEDVKAAIEKPQGMPIPEHASKVVLLQEGALMNIGDGALAPYARTDGTTLKVVIEELGVRLNGKIVSLHLDEAAIEKASPEDLATARFIEGRNGGGSLPEPLLKKLAKANPEMGQALDSQDVVECLSLFRPRLLTIKIGDDGLDDAGRKALRATDPMDFLELSNLKGDDLAFLADMKGIRRLMLAKEFEGKRGHIGRIPTVRGLKSLVLLGADLKDLSSISPQPDLEELALIHCPDIEDLSGLARFKGLKALVVRGNMRSPKPIDLAPLKDLKELRWLSLPATTTQAQLVEVIRDHPDLVMLELLFCSQITDLGPLQDLKNLRIVTVWPGGKDLSPLHAMKQLKFVGVNIGRDFQALDNPKALEDLEKKVTGLQKALPDAVVVLESPLCLGSGWLLLLVPAMALTGLLAWWRRRSRRSSLAARNA